MLLMHISGSADDRLLAETAIGDARAQGMTSIVLCSSYVESGLVSEIAEDHGVGFVSASTVKYLKPKAVRQKIAERLRFAKHSRLAKAA